MYLQFGESHAASIGVTLSTACKSNTWLIQLFFWNLLLEISEASPSKVSQRNLLSFHKLNFYTPSSWSSAESSTITRREHHQQHPRVTRIIYDSSTRHLVSAAAPLSLSKPTIYLGSNHPTCSSKVSPVSCGKRSLSSWKPDRQQLTSYRFTTLVRHQGSSTPLMPLTKPSSRTTYLNLRCGSCTGLSWEVLWRWKAPSSGSSLGELPSYFSCCFVPGAHAELSFDLSIFKVPLLL